MDMDLNLQCMGSMDVIDDLLHSQYSLTANLCAVYLKSQMGITWVYFYSSKLEVHYNQKWYHVE